jgi:hypothetical protein
MVVFLARINPILACAWLLFDLYSTFATYLITVENLPLES